MRYDYLIEPISEEAPCGPDLDEEFDPDYINYFEPAQTRIPERFYDPRNGEFFNRGSINLRDEVKEIDNLLKRTRDLRLLTLEARFQCLAGQFGGFAECLQAMASLLTTFWDTVHPQAWDGDFTLRLNTLGALDHRAAVIQPLEYATILRDRRLGDITYHMYAATAGESDNEEDSGDSGEAENHERVIDAGEIIDALNQDANREAAAKVHQSCVEAIDALTAIRSIFIEQIGYENAPNFDGVRDILADIAKMIATAQPELAGAISDENEDGEAGQGEESDGSGAATSGQVTFAVIDTSSMKVRNHHAAVAALEMVQSYFIANEPSSPALILVHQSRMLVGKPLVEALDLLLPENAERAVIRFDKGLKFELDMTRMRSITGQAHADSIGPPAQGEELDFSVSNRQEAVTLIVAVESFFRAFEPSSPIPMLLSKAKNYMSRDFAAILKDIITAPEPEAEDGY